MKRKLLRILSRFNIWFTLYFMRGWSRIHFLISWATFITVISIALGLTFENIFLGIAFFILLTIAIFIPCTILGYWDMTKGTRISEALRGFELNPSYLRVFDAMFDGLEALAKKQGVNLPENTRRIHKWIKTHRKKLGA